MKIDWAKPEDEQEYEARRAENARREAQFRRQPPAHAIPPIDPNVQRMRDIEAAQRAAAQAGNEDAEQPGSV